MTNLVIPFPLDNITSRYGPRKGGVHDGCDWGRLPAGTPIPASGPGVIHSISRTDRSGNRVGIQYDGVAGTFLYCHLNAPGHLAVGTRVEAGTVIGYIGWTGNVVPPGPAGAHLHLSHYVSGTEHKDPLLSMGDEQPSPPSAPAYPLPAGQFFGPKLGPTQSVSGYFSHREQLRAWQQRMKDRGWNINPDGLYGPQTSDIALAFQREKGLVADRLIGPDTWAAAWAAPIT